MNQLINVQQLIKEQRKIIEMLAMDYLPLAKILERLMGTMDIVLPDVRSSILHFNENLHTLEKPIGPHLPEAYLNNMDGLKVGPNAGSCGAAAYFKEKVLVEDTMTDPHWKDLREYATLYNLKACWSLPITSESGHLFGTLAFYLQEKRLPSEEELDLLHQFSQLAAVIIDKKKSEDDLILANRVIENSPAIIFRWKPEKGWPIDYVSQNVKQLGYTPDMFIQEKIDFSFIIHPDDLSRIEQEVDEYLSKKINQYQQEYRLITADGQVRWIDDRTTITRSITGEIQHIEGVLIDITERKEAEQQVFYLANNDPLTGIPNRRYFKQELERSLIDRERTTDRLGVLYLDCDNFKQINDDLGHDAGDEFLMHLSKRLHNCLRGEDLIARIGGDEFNVLVKNITSENDIIKVAERLINASSEPWEICGKVYHVTMSIGVAVVPDDGVEVDDLIRKADRALYKAKESGKNKLMWYVPQMSI